MPGRLCVCEGVCFEPLPPSSPHPNPESTCGIWLCAQRKEQLPKRRIPAGLGAAETLQATLEAGCKPSFPPAVWICVGYLEGDELLFRESVAVDDLHLLDQSAFATLCCTWRATETPLKRFFFSFFTQVKIPATVARAHTLNPRELVPGLSQPHLVTVF